MAVSSYHTGVKAEFLRHAGTRIALESGGSALLGGALALTLYAGFNRGSDNSSFASDVVLQLRADSLTVRGEPLQIAPENELLHDVVVRIDVPTKTSGKDTNSGQKIPVSESKDPFEKPKAYIDPTQASGVILRNHEWIAFFCDQISGKMYDAKGNEIEKLPGELCIVHDDFAVIGDTHPIDKATIE